MVLTFLAPPLSNPDAHRSPGKVMMEKGDMY